MNEKPLPGPDVIGAILQAAQGMMAHTRCDERTAIRRIIGTAEWKDDEARVQAAEAKRARKLNKRASQGDQVSPAPVWSDPSAAGVCPDKLRDPDAL